MSLRDYTHYIDYRHIILYAKGHYKRTDPMADLKQILSHRNGVSVEYLRNADVVRTLLSVLQDHLKTFGSYTFPNFILRLAPDAVWQSGYPKDTVYDYATAIVYTTISFLCQLSVRDMETMRYTLRIGSPDPAVLPLKDHYHVLTVPDQITTKALLDIVRNDSAVSQYEHPVVDALDSWVYSNKTVLQYASDRDCQRIYTQVHQEFTPNECEVI